MQYKFQIFFECLVCLWHLPHYVFAHLTHRYAFIPTDEIIEKQQLFIFYSERASDILIHDVRNKELR